MIDVSAGTAETGIRISVWNTPAGGAASGGDWCEVVPLSPETVALTVGDVAGHGSDAAATMTAMRSAILAAIGHHHDPAAVLARANRLVAGYEQGRIATAIVAFLDRRLRTLTFASAGHPPPLLLSGEHHAFLQCGPADLPLGVFPGHRAANYVVALPADALVVLYTDGITERTRDLIAGEIELAQAAQRAYATGGSDAAEAIAAHIFRDGPAWDDAALMAVRLSEGPAEGESNVSTLPYRQTDQRRTTVKKAGRKTPEPRASPHDAMPESDAVFPILAAILDIVPSSRWSFAQLDARGELDAVYGSDVKADAPRRLADEYARQRSKAAAGSRIAATLGSLDDFASGITLVFADAHANFGILVLLRTAEWDRSPRPKSAC